MRKKMLLCAVPALAMFIANVATATVLTPSTSTFENAGAEGASINLTDGDGGYWYGEGSTFGVVTNVANLADTYSGTRPSEAASSKCLYVEAETPILRGVSANTSSADEAAITPATIGEYLYIDFMVQFTATDSAPDTGASDKLCIWLKEDNSTYSLAVTAGKYVSGWDKAVYDITTLDGTAVAAAYFAPEKWYRLTVKAINNISSTSTVVPGFVVYVDGKIAGYTGGCGFTATNSVAANYAGSLLPSIVQTGDNTVKALALSGNGFVDDINFTLTAPSFATGSIADPGVIVDVEKPAAAGENEVTYSIVNGSGTAVAAGTTFNPADVTTGEYTIKATWDGQADPVTVETLGVIKKTVGAKTYLSVPWTDLAGTNIKVQDYIDPASLSLEDTLRVTTDGADYTIYIVTSVGGVNAWVKKLANGELENGATADTLAPGAVAVLTHSGAAAEVTIFGAKNNVADKTVTVNDTLAVGNVLGTARSVTEFVKEEAGYAITKAAGTSALGAKDMVGIPDASGNFKTYFYGSDGNLYKETRTSVTVGNKTINKTTTVQVAPADISIGPGEVFFYKSQGGNPKVDFE